MAQQNTFHPAAAQAPAAATAAVCTLATPGDPTTRWVVNEISWSYSAAPAAGATLVIAWTDSTGSYTETYYIIAGGPGVITYKQPRQWPPGVGLTVTLASGGGTVVGTVYVDAYTGV